METWQLNDIAVEPHQPQVLDSEAEGRAIVINLPAGEELQEHQVHERAWLLVSDGEIEVSDADGSSIKGSAGLLAIFDPRERRRVIATKDSRLLLILSPWPGEGHPSAASRST